MEMWPCRPNSKRKNRPYGHACWKLASKRSSSEKIVRRRRTITMEQGGGFYAEFLAPLEGSEYDRSGKRKATKEVGGVSSQLLRYIEILLLSPWKVELGEENGYALSPKGPVQIANPASFLAQKILIHPQRDIIQAG